jgi:hypothetical protein
MHKSPQNLKGIKLRHLLIAIVVVGVGLGILPQRIGIPALIVIEGLLLVALVGLCGRAVVRRFYKK